MSENTDKRRISERMRIDVTDGAISVNALLYTAEELRRMIQILEANAQFLASKDASASGPSIKEEK